MTERTGMLTNSCSQCLPAQGQNPRESSPNAARAVVLKVSSPYLQHYQSCQHFNGGLPGKGPVSGGELVVSKRQRDMSFRLLPTIWTAEMLSWAWARAQCCKAPLMGSSWAALSLLHLVQKWYSHPCWASWGAGELAPRQESSVLRRQQPALKGWKPEQAAANITFHWCSCKTRQLL